MEKRAIQDFYPEPHALCYGCGRLNEHGLHVKSYWEGEEAVCTFKPAPYHTAIKGFVYGGLIASLIDCHCTGTAAGASYRAEGREIGSDPPLRFVTASLRVDYMKPTPIGEELELRARAKEISGRKVIVTATLSANGIVTARGEMVAVRVPGDLVKDA